MTVSALCHAADGPTADTEVVPAGLTNLTLDFLAEQQVLDEAEDSLATPAQLTAWQQANASILQLQNQRMRKLAAWSAFHLQEMVTEIDVPAGSSPALQSFMVNGADLANRFAQIHNQLVAQAPAVNMDAANALAEAETAQFQQENASAVAAQVVQAKTIADQAEHQPLAYPPTLTFPPGFDPARKTFLAAQDQYERDEIAMHNAYCAGDLPTLDAVMDQWHHQNLARLQAIQNMAQNLAPAS